jgi:hypothetical protein
MGVQRYPLPSGAVRYRARVKSLGRYVATRVFQRKADAVAWEQDSVGGFGSVNGSTRVVVRFRCRR